MATKNVVPRANNEGKVGTSTKKWNEVNAVTVNADNIVTELAGKASTTHNQDASTINAGTLDGDRLPVISTTKKGGVPATGTPAGKYLKDDGTWDTPASGGGAPTDAHYLTDQAEAGLSAEVVVSANGKSLVTAADYAAMRTLLNVEDGATKYPDTGEQAFLDADHSKLDGIAAGANNYVHPNHSGDVTSVADGAQTIAAKAVTLAKMADMATASLIYRKTAGAGAPEVNTLATLKTDLALAKADVGLGNCDNTSDANKPVSTATQTALDGKSATSHNHALNNLSEKSYNSLTDKPSIPSTFDDLTDGTTNKAFTATEKTKLSGIADGAEVNVNADWNASSGDAQILNKPSTMTPSSHNNSAHSETYITLSSVTDANLSTTDVTTNDVSTVKHGLCPKAPNDTAKFLRGDGTWNTPSGGSAAQVLHIQDQKTAPADGGSSVAGIQTRVLNTVVLNEITGASLASNQITLPAGTYEVYAFAPTYAVGATQAGIYNVTDSAYLLMGTNAYDIAGAFVQGKFTLAAEKVIGLRHFTQTARSGNGLGVSANSGIGKEVFANIMIRKV